MVIRKIPRTASVFVEISATFLVRLREKGWHSAFYFLCYYVNNLFVSFCNCHLNSRRVTCPCCAWCGYDFIPLDGIVFWAPHMVCPNCLAYDRHRAFFLYVNNHDDRLLKHKGITLHFAPEKSISALVCRNVSHYYVTTDIQPDKLRKNMEPSFISDIKQISLLDDSVDILICFHVLEHIDHIHTAAEELYRILKPGGIAYFMSPVNTKMEQSYFFGRPNPDLYDHYWAFGRDFTTHLELFDSCDEIAPDVYLTEDDIKLYAVSISEAVYVCGKHA